MSTSYTTQPSSHAVLFNAINVYEFDCTSFRSHFSDDDRSRKQQQHKRTWRTSTSSSSFTRRTTTSTFLYDDDADEDTTAQSVWGANVAHSQYKESAQDMGLLNGMNAFQMVGSMLDGTSIVLDVVGVDCECYLELFLHTDRTDDQFGENINPYGDWTPADVDVFVRTVIFGSKPHLLESGLLRWELVKKKPMIANCGDDEFPYIKFFFKGTQQNWNRNYRPHLKQPLMLPRLANRGRFVLNLCETDFDICTRHFARRRPSGEEGDSPLSWFTLPPDAVRVQDQSRGVLHYRWRWRPHVLVAHRDMVQIAPIRGISLDFEALNPPNVKIKEQVGICTSACLVDFLGDTIQRSTVYYLRSNAYTGRNTPKHLAWLDNLNSDIPWVRAALKEYHLPTDRMPSRCERVYEDYDFDDPDFGPVSIRFFDTKKQLLLAVLHHLGSTGALYYTGYNIDEFDMWFLYNACKAEGISDAEINQLSMFTYQSVRSVVVEKHSDAAGVVARDTIDVPGRFILDLYPEMRRMYRRELRSFKLSAVLKHVFPSKPAYWKIDNDFRVMSLMWYLGLYEHELRYVARDAQVVVVLAADRQVLTAHLAVGKFAKCTMSTLLYKMQTARVVSAITPVMEEVHVIQNRNVNSFRGLPWAEELEAKESHSYVSFTPTQLQDPHIASMLHSARQMDYRPLVAFFKKQDAKRLPQVVANLYNVPFWEVVNMVKPLPALTKATGGKVQKPKRTFFPVPIGVVDFNSLYPSIILAFFICFCSVFVDKRYKMWAQRHGYRVLTKRTRAEENTVVDVLQEFHNAALQPILPSVVQTMLSLRQVYKDKQKLKDITNEQRALFKQYEMAVKALNNSFYGFALKRTGETYKFPLMGELIPAIGREFIDRIDYIFRSNGATLIYGDTDSIMVTWVREALEILTSNPTQETREAVLRYVWQRMREVTQKCNDELSQISPHLKLALEKLLGYAIFLTAKYYSYEKYETESDKPGSSRICHAGWAAARGTTSPYIKSKLAEISDAIHHHGMTSAFADFFAGIVADLRCRAIPEEISLLSFCDSVGITQYLPYHPQHATSANKYKTVPAHGHAAMRMNQENPRLAPDVNSKISVLMMTHPQHAPLSQNRASDRMYMREHAEILMRRDMQWQVDRMHIFGAIMSAMSNHLLCIFGEKPAQQYQNNYLLVVKNYFECENLSLAEMKLSNYERLQKVRIRKVMRPRRAMLQEHTDETHETLLASNAEYAQLWETERTLRQEWWEQVRAVFARRPLPKEQFMAVIQDAMRLSREEFDARLRQLVSGNRDDANADDDDDHDDEDDEIEE